MIGVFREGECFLMRVRRLWKGGLVLLLWVLGEASACAGAWVLLKTAVVPNTCELRVSSGSSLTMGVSSLSDFRRESRGGRRNDAFTLYFPDVGCRHAAFGAGNPLVLTVSGPAARGAGQGAWGNYHDDVAYGIRLQYQLNDRYHRVPLSPADNTLTIGQSGRHRYDEDNTDFRVVMRPEIRSWDMARVRPGTALAVPLVFLVRYQ